MKKGWNLKRIPGLQEAALAMDWGFRDNFEDIVTPISWIELEGTIVKFLKLT